eukprot:13544733-Heterocapsa_arctica.AAC.1
MCRAEKDKTKRPRAKVDEQKQLRSNSDAVIAAVAQEHPLALRSMGLKVPITRAMNEQRAASCLRLALQPTVRGNSTARSAQVRATDLVAHVAMQQQQIYIAGMLGLHSDQEQEQVLGAGRIVACVWQWDETSQRMKSLKP